MIITIICLSNEIYEGDYEIKDEDGDLVDFKEPVYMTKQYYL